MQPQTRHETVAALSQRILDMAQTGIYRESIFDALHPIATKKNIRLAIARAKTFGLHSVASLRDETLGTYYQLDVEKYRSLKHALKTDMPHDDDQLIATAIEMTHTLNRVLKVAQGITVVLLLSGLGCWSIGQRDASAGLLIGAASAAGIWALQHRLVRKLAQHS